MLNNEDREWLKTQTDALIAAAEAACADRTPRFGYRESTVKFEQDVATMQCEIDERVAKTQPRFAYREDDTAFRRGGTGKNTREFYMCNGSYLFCEVLEASPNLLKCVTPNGRVFFAKHALGHMCEISESDIRRIIERGF